MPERFSKGALLWLSGPYRLLAPDFLILEAGNVLWKKVRRHEIDGHTAESILTVIADGEIQFRSVVRHGRAAWRLAIELDHPVYDCLYLALAAAEGAAPVTADQGFYRRVATSRWADRIRWVEDLPSI